MKESRCQLIKPAKPEKGTSESIRVGSNFIRLARATSFDSFHLLFFLQTRGTVRETKLFFLFIPLARARRVYPYFFRKFFFHNAKDTLEL